MSIKQNVEKILARDDQSRNSDNRLFKQYYLYYCDGDIGDNVNDFFDKIPALMTISRARREIQHAGFYPSDKHIKARRKELEEEYRREYSIYG